jgi:hypothetical protein
MLTTAGYSQCQLAGRDGFFRGFGNWVLKIKWLVGRIKSDLSFYRVSIRWGMSLFP